MIKIAQRILVPALRAHPVRFYSVVTDPLSEVEFLKKAELYLEVNCYLTFSLAELDREVGQDRTPSFR